METYRDRFAAERYAADESVSFAASGRFWAIPERLFSRAQQIGAAYELRLLPAIDIHQPTALSRDQCRALADEVTFIREVVADPLLQRHLTEIQELAAVCWRSATDQALVIEGP